MDKDGNIVGKMVPDTVLCTLQLTIFTIGSKATRTYTNHWKTEFSNGHNKPLVRLNSDLPKGSYTCNVKFGLRKEAKKPFTNQEEADAFIDEKRTVSLSVPFVVK